ncbi:hypothetical protein CHLRE_11g467522v5 [Chlamydomonas reinhardtii]|uniref:Reverse transcriptase domain-containing protein n=1 Tax=Chlamydomonas reinhardtii TaxID=3055 RepID=A0A2K3D751_CHLRE|nr:uncharacterized protein CHLRE_11g467522v5 [Chlamydomonas reinhardtii]PNW76362.1 hypothetical protein CHLRE_11g467522v5 [Chlamydomonas reinhardtii]
MEPTLFLRLLPHLLRQQGRQGLIAFLDFEKAYNTVDLTFLSEAMEAAGAGPNLRGWVHTLLADTRARAQIQGAHSQPVSMMAGVGQGCPLSPLLYLFVAHALLCWLRHKGVGLRLDPADLQRVAAVQYADDTKALLEGEQEVVAFLAAMHTFQHASGQRLNLSKQGQLPQQQPQQQQQQQAQIQTDTQQAIDTAVIDLWGRLKAFTALGVPRKGWDQAITGSDED